MERIIGIKQLHKELSQIPQMVSKGESYIVVKNSKAVFKIVPYRVEKKERKYNIKDFKKLQFSQDKNLSKEIDKTVYPNL